MGSDTIPDVFVIESLPIQDEKYERFEGPDSPDLRLSDKHSTYYYIRTLRELRKLALLGRVGGNEVEGSVAAIAVTIEGAYHRARFDWKPPQVKAECRTQNAERRTQNAEFRMKKA